MHNAPGHKACLSTLDGIYMGARQQPATSSVCTQCCWHILAYRSAGLGNPNSSKRSFSTASSIMMPKASVYTVRPVHTLIHACSPCGAGLCDNLLFLEFAMHARSLGIGMLPYLLPTLSY